MDFLKEVLGEELFNQFKAKVDQYNGDEANKEKLIKIANLTSGEYVGKGKHEALEALLKGKETEIAEANKLIEDLKKGTQGNEELQGKITAYEGQVADLQAQLADTKLKSAIKVALMSEKAVDVDYLTYKLNEKLNEKGEKLELDENDNIKNWSTQLEGLKTQFPNMFDTGGTNGGFVPIDGKGLPKGEPNKKLTREELLKKSYAERQALYEEDPEAYNAAMNS